MLIIAFLEQCEVEISDEDITVPRTFYSGEEIEIESIRECKGLSVITFSDGTVGNVLSEYIIKISESPEDFWNEDE